MRVRVEANRDGGSAHHGEVEERMGRAMGAVSGGGTLLVVAVLVVLVPKHRRFDLLQGTVGRLGASASGTATGGGAAGGWNHSSAGSSVKDAEGSRRFLADQKVDWQLAYKTSSGVATGSEQGWDEDTIRAVRRASLPA